MSFDTHQNLSVAPSGVTVAPSPANSGTTLSVSDTEAANFPDPGAAGNSPYNCTVCPAGTQPNPSNSEIVRVTAKGAAGSGGGSNTQFTITRVQEGIGARSILVGDQFAMTETAKVFTDIEAPETVLADFVMSGLVPTVPANSLTMTIPLGVIWIAQQKASIAADGGHTYTISKDTYVDVSKTGTYTYTAVNNGAQAPALTANTVRLGIVVTNGTKITDFIGVGMDTNNTPLSSLSPDVAQANGGWIPAGETWTYASVDGHNFTFTVPADVSKKYWPGMRISCINNSLQFFGIIVKVAVSGTTTTITVYGGTNYALANSAITNPMYSYAKAPLGFNPDPAIWSETVTDTSAQTQNTPTTGTYYNMGTLQIAVPIGCWRLHYSVCMSSNQSTATNAGAQVGLSTANNSLSDTDLISACWGLQSPTIQTRKEKYINIASKTTYYLVSTPIFSGQTNMSYRGDEGETILKAECAYL